MFLERGAFDTFPQEWIGVLPFNNWASLALFGMIVFGIGNGIASTYGFKNNDKKIHNDLHYGSFIFLLYCYTNYFVGRMVLTNISIFCIKLNPNFTWFIWFPHCLFGFVTKKS
ncbi:hypothetical protein [Sporosarcina psychrophila]|uniref:Heparan-alpha-glucosaminide N-acetyltransferase catalytic domain-containing protein n=1 Tax=Sporosarcina psychrophila TaxID=1476 RepID=A0ABV2KAF8_SPOPS